MALTRVFHCGWSMDGKVPFVEFLLDHGADPYATDDDGFQAVEFLGWSVAADPIELRTMVDLFRSRGIAIPKPSEKFSKHIAAVIEEQSREAEKHQLD